MSKGQKSISIFLATQYGAINRVKEILEAGLYDVNQPDQETGEFFFFQFVTQ